MMTRKAIRPLKMATFVGAALLVWGLLLAYASSPAWAATITVDTTADEQNTNQQCSLREAIINANADDQSGSSDCTPGSGADTIEVPRGTYPLSSGLPNITTTITIDGASPNPTINGGNAVRPFIVAGGAKLSLNDLDVIKANSSAVLESQGGGAIRNEGTLEVSDSLFSGNYSPSEGGGAIYNEGTMQVSDSLFSSNVSVYDGGAIHNEGTLEVSTSTFFRNRTESKGGAIENTISGTATVGTSTFSDNSAALYGGAISNELELDVTNSTFSGNSASIYGGGLYTFNTLPQNTSTITNSTFTLNGASNGGGIFKDYRTAPLLKNTIVANSTSGGDCSGATDVSGATDGGYNLIRDGSCITEATSLSGVDPMLAPLGDNGGPTETHALLVEILARSPAIDAIPVGKNGCGSDITQDQRGVYRPQGSACDIGAFELEQFGEEPDASPSVTVARGGSCGTDGRSGTVRLSVSDEDDPSSALSLSATSSNRALVPNANISFSGSGDDRAMTISPRANKSGSAMIKITISDGDLESTEIVNVKVGTNGVDALNGTARADVLFGLDGVDAINGLGSNDLLCGGQDVDALNGNGGDDTLFGGAGNDALRGGRGEDRIFGGRGKDELHGDGGSDVVSGGSGGDRFSGGTGTDTATDFKASQGDTRDNTVEWF